MIKVAITGNIASGKSFAQNYIESKGYLVIDSDNINHFILMNDKDAVSQIKLLFNDTNILDDSNNLSREKIGRIVFSDTEKKEALEKILYPKITEKINEIIAANKDKDIIFVAVPQLFEAGMTGDFDKIIFISAREDIRLNRLMDRNGYDKEYAEQRINSQLSEEYKIKHSDFVIENNSDRESFKIHIESVLQKLIS